MRAWVPRAAAALARRPELLTTAARQALRLAPPGWWRSAPHLPLPDPGYLAFRFKTAYGDSEQPPDPHDIVTYLEWCRAWPLVAAPPRS